MIRNLAKRTMVALLPIATCGCVAAAIPVVAGGGIASTALRSRPATTPVVPANAKPAPPADPDPGTAPAPSDPAVVVALRPKDATQMMSGVVYAGSLPAPPDASRTSVPLSQEIRPPVAQTKEDALWSWSDVVPFVASQVLSAPKHSVLLERGSGLTEPRWSACGEKPRAVLADLGSAAFQDLNGNWKIDSNALRWLQALQTLDLRVIFVSREPGEAAGFVKAVFDTAGLGRLVPDDGFRLVSSTASLSDARTAVAAAYCVVAVVGRSPAAFPNAASPSTTPAPLAGVWGAGWFRVADAH